VEWEELTEKLANLTLIDKETGETLKLKQVVIKHYKNFSRAKSFLMNFVDHKNREKFIKALEELQTKGVTYFFTVDSYYDNEYLKLYIVKIVKDKPKTTEVLENEKMGTHT
jgi:hypothetical protein